MSEERKKSLGEFLKSERERRGLTIEQTSSATKIGLKILKQLEADQYVDLPALPFVRGFIRNYGKFLGLDGEKLLLEYAGFLEAHANERPKRDAGHSGYAFERPEGEQSRKILWGVMAGMLIFGGAVVFLFKPSLKRKHHGHVDKMKPGGGMDTDLEDGATPNPEASASPVAETSPVPSPLAAKSTSASSPVASPAPRATPSAAVVAASAPSPVPSPETPFIPPKVPLVLAPSPLPAPSAAPTHAAAATPAASPASKPTPVPSSAPKASASPTPEDDLKKDPLQSGRELAPRDVHTKIILRTKADVWVRYRCDGKQLMKFALKKDKILVLRAKTSAYLQVSNPDSITIQIPGGPEEVFSQSAAVFDFRGNSTVAYPPQVREKIEENFKVVQPLPFIDASPSVQ